MNNTIFENTYQTVSKKATRLNDYIQYYLSELFAREAPFKTVEKYCMFIGYPRSGHSLIGALLDAHPNIIIAHELNDLRYFARGFSKRKSIIYYYEVLSDTLRLDDERLSILMKFPTNGKGNLKVSKLLEIKREAVAFKFFKKIPIF